MNRDLNQILRGGYCTRWHANQDMAHIRETLAEHHARVAQIILALHPAPTLRLIDAALHHDAGEPAVGDVPWPVKRDNPELATMLDKAEADERKRIGCNVDLNAEDTAWLKLADRLAGIAHVAQTNPRLLSKKDWQRDIDYAEDQAYQIGVGDVVDAILKELAPF